MESKVERQNLDGESRKQSLTLSRNYFYLFLLGCLILPVIAVACYAAELRGVFFVALVSLLLSGYGAWYLLRMWEMKMQRSVSKIVNMRLAQTALSPATDEVVQLQTELAESRRGYEHQIDLLQSSVAKSKEEVRQLNLEMDRKLEEMRLAYLEFEDLRKEYHRLEEDYAHAYEEGQKKLQHKESLNNEYQRTIAEQRMILEKKQLYISKLEGKVRDLMYEIRSLLQLEEIPADTPPLNTETYLPASNSSTTPYDLSLQLQRFIEKAENQMGMDHLGGKSPRFLDMSDSYAVDRRRLFDSFRDETDGIVFILSISENKFLFVNQHVKALLGWSPEKFMKEFPRLVVSGFREWKEALKNIGSIAQECQTQIAIQGKSGEKRAFACIMGMVSKGPFTNHIIGILS